MADNAVVPYDPTKLMDAVRDRIKAEFVGLIPEDTWKQMVAAEVKKFFAEETRSGYQEDRKLPSLFSRVVWEELERNSRERVRTMLSSQEWQGRFGFSNNQQTCEASEMVKKLVVEKSGEILAGILGGAIQQTIDSMRQRV